MRSLVIGFAAIVFACVPAAGQAEELVLLTLKWITRTTPTGINKTEATVNERSVRLLVVPNRRFQHTALDANRAIRISGEVQLQGESDPALELKSRVTSPTGTSTTETTIVLPFGQVQTFSGLTLVTKKERTRVELVAVLEQAGPLLFW